MKLCNGDCLDELKTIAENTIDSLITDPPAGISFMGKEWDDDKGGRKQWIAWMTEVMSECLRVMKPGAHGLIWAIPRTSHWTATALEDAGFEIRDVVTHLFGSGFPKSHNIGHSLTEWQGWGTALKPASEHWILVRKPCSEKTVAKNVEKWGCGGINIDGSRIGYHSEIDKSSATPQGKCTSGGLVTNVGIIKKEFDRPKLKGRFPANLVLSHSEHCTDEQCDIECAIKMLDEQSGTLKSAGEYKNSKNKPIEDGSSLFGLGNNCRDNSYSGQSGGASRFFYCAKASKTDKNAGLEGMPKKVLATSNHGQEEPISGRLGANPLARQDPTANFHPTVKSTKLMRYLIKLITPPNGIVLDPFMGSGSTGVAAKAEGFQFVGIERDKEYMQIAEKRIYHAFPEFKKQIQK